MPEERIIEDVDCANCNWEIAAVYDKEDQVYRCSDCGSDIDVA